MKRKITIIVVSILLLICIGLLILKIFWDDNDGIKITEDNINLSNYSKDVIITKGGEYTLSGNLDYSIYIDADGEEVILNLNNVNINSPKSAAIIGKKQKLLTINITPGSTNIVKNGKEEESDYDASIFSSSDLIIEGDGTLIVNGSGKDGEGIATKNANITINGGNIKITSIDDGLNTGGDNGGLITLNGGTIYIDASGDGIDSNQKMVINGGTLFVMGSDKGGNAGLDTDAGYTINGGLVIALGSDMLELPQTSSFQNTIAFTLDNFIDPGTLMTLTDSNENAVVSFVSEKKFKTIIISTNNLLNGTYYLYENGTNTGVLANGIYTGGLYTKGDKITVNNETEFIVNSSVMMYGESNKENSGM